MYLWPQFPDISAATDRTKEIRSRQSLQREGSEKTPVTMPVSSYTVRERRFLLCDLRAGATPDKA